MRLLTCFRSVRLLLLAVIICGAASAAQGAVPAPWQAQDVGAPSPAGTSSHNSGTFTVTASGADIWNTSDQFHFIYQQLSGDVDVVVRVNSLGPTDEWAKAGIMFRSSLSATAREVLVAVTPAPGVTFQHRASGGSSTVSDGFRSGYGAPRWLRLVRAGDTITAYHGTDGAQWTRINSITQSLPASIYVGLAVTSHASGISTTATLSNVSVKSAAAGGTGGTVPAPQTAADIGAPAISGSATYASGKYTINAGGWDIWGTSDSFHYVYQPVSGDVEIIARVTGLGASDPWAKAGVMVRETLAANSRHADVMITSGNGYSFQRRIDAGGSTISNIGFSGAAPGWVRLVRTGYKFDAYRSTDGTTWTPMASDTVPMTDPVYVGLAVTSHNVNLGTTSTIDNLTIRAAGAPAPPPPPGDTQAPTAPGNLTAAAAGNQANLSWAASTDNVGVTNYLVDRCQGAGCTSFAQIGTSTTTSYSVPGLSPSTAYSFRVRATDAAGNVSGYSNVASVTTPAGSDTQPPTAPGTPTATAASSTQINVTWPAATDNAGVTGYLVERCQGSSCTAFAQVGTPSGTSYSDSALVASTTYRYRVRAKDGAGNLGPYSTVASATTQAAATTPPTQVVFTASTDHSTTKVTGYRLEVFAAGANPSSATPVATSDLGKPAPATNGDITVDRATFFSGLAAGSYQATVSAYGPGGTSRSTTVAFTR